MVFLLSFILVNAQKTKTVTTSYTYRTSQTESVEAAKREALKGAQRKAIEDEFGTFISQSNTNVVTSQNGKSESHFKSISTSDLKGEWIETIGDPQFTVKIEDDLLIVECNVKGKIRELTPSKLDFEAHTLCNGYEQKHRRAEFMDGDDFYLYFKSPYNGYLMVFLVDYTQEMACCILPYRESPDQLYKVEKDKEYIFFSREYADAAERKILDSYHLYSESPVDSNDIYVIFCDEPFVISNMVYDESGLKVMPMKNFDKWIAKLRKDYKDLLIKTYNINITKYK